MKWIALYPFGIMDWYSTGYIYTGIFVAKEKKKIFGQI